ncbi:hypothetical protein GALLR39Z86_23690 [Glycomyces algeriensis]|uniref:Uncharacterized protein n=1 Tax=Glycomyces algeriensis TaxID=256037 RepID=A0A9W6G950_9ACTN|nr:hypothetical protein GALLR39Z86_23690 [Glycomyces algeriensis]
MAAWAWYSPGAIGIDRKLKSATQVAAWAPDPTKVGRYGVARKRWTPEEDQIVRVHSIAEAAKLLGRTEQSVNLRRWRLRNAASESGTRSGPMSRGISSGYEGIPAQGVPIGGLRPVDP